MAIKYYYRMHEKCGSSNSIENITNKNCLKNFIKGISNIDNLIINIDNSSEIFVEEIKKIHPHISTSNCGNGFSFLKTVDEAILQNSDEDIIYFVENDYVHLPDIDAYILDGFKTGASLVTLYDHNDKYTSYPELVSKVVIGELCHWRTTPSTCMTFAAKIRTLKRHKDILVKYSSFEKQPHDHYMFIALGNAGNVLVSPIPGRCSHGERGCLSPFISWDNIVENS